MLHFDYQINNSSCRECREKREAGQGGGELTCAHSMAAQARVRDRETRVEREVRQERGEEGRPYNQPGV